MTDIKTMIRYYCEHSEPPTVILDDPSNQDNAIRIHTVNTDHGVWLSPEDAEGLGNALIAMAARARKARENPEPLSLCGDVENVSRHMCDLPRGHKGSHARGDLAWPNKGAK